MVRRLKEDMDGKTLLDKSIELARRLYGYTANYEMSSESRMDLQADLVKLIEIIEGVREYYLDVESGSNTSYAYEGTKLRARHNMHENIDIDMWYGDPFKKGYYGADAYFNESDFVYRGNIYDPKTGEIIGDYECDDSTEIEKMFRFKWNGSEK